MSSLQQLIDCFTAEHEDKHDTFELFAEYLLYCSDLAKERDDALELDSEDWEQPLETLMESLLDGDLEPASNLELIDSTQLDGEYLRDFIAWFLLRETDMNSLTLQQHTQTLRDWLGFIQQQQRLPSDQVTALLTAIKETEPEASRTCQAGYVLFHIARLGVSCPPRQQEKIFTDFVEGHARITHIADGQVTMGFDNLENYTVTLCLPESLLQLLGIGDVLDVELGMRNEQWQIVDCGPVYPPCIYVEADYLDIPEKIIPNDA